MRSFVISAGSGLGSVECGKLVMALGICAPRLLVGSTLKSPLAPGDPGFVCWSKCPGAASSRGSSPRPRSSPLPQLPPGRAGHRLSQRRPPPQRRAPLAGAGPCCALLQTCAAPPRKHHPGRGEGGEAGRRELSACHSAVGRARLQIGGVLTACCVLQLRLRGAWSEPAGSVLATRLGG